MDRHHRLKHFLHSFNGRLLLTLAGVHLLLVPLLLFGVYLVAKPGVQGQFVNQVRSDALLFGTLMATPLATGDRDAIGGLMDEFLLNGRLVFAELQTADGSIRPSVPPATAQAFDEDFFFGQHRDDTYFISVPLAEADSATPALLRLGYDEKPVQAELFSLFQRGMYLVGGYLGVTLLVVAWLGRRLVRPLELLRMEADQISSGKQNREFRAHTRIVEVAALAENLERMRQGFVAARDAALQAALTKNEFLANMSHEIRTPINGVIGMLELAQRTELTAQQRDYLGMAGSSAESLLRLLNDILDFSKIEARKLELEQVDFDPRESVGDILKLLAPQAHGKGLELTFLIDRDIPEVLSGDAGRLGQILLNLVSNAIKFTARGEITVRVESGCGLCGGRLCPRFSVSDTGIGIPPDQQRHIFEAFTQADASSTRMFGGTGLGLSISSRLVELMGGNLWLESEVGRGSTFHFSIPFDVPDLAGLPRRAPADLRGIRVLVVDDHPLNRRIFMEMLAQWGMQPAEVDGGAAALAEIHRAAALDSPYRLILLDAMMPGMDGFEVASRITSDPSVGPTTIMLLSSADRPGDVDLSRRLGITRFLRKPVKYSELMHAIEDALGESAADPAAAGPPSAAALRPLARPLNILVAEDNPVNQCLVLEFLAERGHRVCLVGNGAEAVGRCGREAFDAILMDVQMPVMDGFQATAAIRERERERGGPPAYIVAMTAHALKGDRERCLAAGMDHYVCKPIREPELLAAVERWDAGEGPAQPGEVLAMLSDTPPFDLEAALARVRHKNKLLRTLAGIVIGQADGLLLECRAAIRESDGPRLELAAHTLKGSVGSLCAQTAAELAQTLENLGRAGDFPAAAVAYPRLEAEMARLLAALREFLAQADPAGG